MLQHLSQAVHREEFLPHLVYSNLNVTVTVRIYIKHVSLCTTLKKMAHTLNSYCFYMPLMMTNSAACLNTYLTSAACDLSSVCVCLPGGVGLCRRRGDVEVLQGTAAPPGWCT